jgi:sugar phosphate isomerase/epimerase
MGDFDTHTLPGKGNVNWNHILGTLALAPKLRVIQCEVIPAANMVPISALTAFFSNVKISRDSL